MLVLLLAAAPAPACSCSEEIEVARGLPASDGAPLNTRIYVPVISRGAEFVSGSSAEVVLIGPDGPVALAYVGDWGTTRGAMGFWQPRTELAPDTEYVVQARVSSWQEDAESWSFTTGGAADEVAPARPTVRSATTHTGTNDDDGDSCAVTPQSSEVELELAGREPVFVVLDRGLSVYVDEGRQDATLEWTYDFFCDHDPGFLGGTVAARTVDLAGNTSAESPRVEVVSTSDPEGSRGGRGGGGCAVSRAPGGLVAVLLALLVGRRRSLNAAGHTETPEQRT